MRIPANNLKTQLGPLEDRLRQAFERVLQSGWYLGGPETQAFEKEFATFAGAGFTVSCANGTDALMLAFRALGLGAGDEIILPSHTALPCYHAVLAAGCVPVFADVDKYHCLDPESARSAIGKRTKAVLGVHLYGQPCDLEGLASVCREHGLLLIEDCAQAHGARFHDAAVGTYGSLAAFSFYPTKNLGALGDAGALCGKDEELEARIRRIKSYGESSRYVSVEEGVNSRMDELQAAFLRVRLSHLGRELAQREALAGLYTDCLADAPVKLPQVRPGCLHGWHLYVIQVERRDELVRFLADKGIGTGIHYPVPGHRQELFAGRKSGVRSVELPHTEALVDEIVSLPFYPGLGDGDVQMVCEAINEFYGVG